MHKSLYVLATAATLCLADNVSQAMPITGGALRDAINATDLVEKTAIYVVDGRRYCFYFNGWHGPGWYRCGFAFRRGLGWGGVYGWRGWEYGPAARRFGRGGITIREGSRQRDRMTIRDGSRREGTTVREGSTFREGTSSRDGASTREGATTRGRIQQGTTQEGATVRGGANVGGDTSGRGAEGSSRSGTSIQGGGGSGGGQMSPSGGEGRGGGQGGGDSRGGDRR